MNKENITYDEAMAKAETVIQQLEQSEAISLSEYKKLAQEAKELLAFCRGEIEKLGKQLEEDAK